MNWNRCRDILIDELSVEGLEGCTFDHLYRIVKPLLLNDENLLANEIHFRSYLWRILVSTSCIEFYELNSPLGPAPQPNELIIENVESNHRGYSPSYHRRKFLSRKSDLIQLENVSIIDRVYLVVEQNVREFRITQGQYDTKQLFSKYEYALLECICKTRSKGIPTSGNDGLAKIFNINSKSLFYYLKQLISLDIVKKLNLTRQLVGTLKQPMLILTRYVTRSDYLNSKYTIIDRLKTYLEQCPNYSCERNHLKSYLSLGEKSFRSLMRKCKRSNTIEKYNKTMNEYELKRLLSNESENSSVICLNNRARLRSYTFFRLKSQQAKKDDDEELASSSDENEQTDDDDAEDGEDEDEGAASADEEDPDMAPLSEASSQLDLTQLRLFVDRPFHFQYYQLLEQVKEIGLSQRDLAQVCHLSFYSARSEIKSLTKNMKHIALKSVQLNPKGKIMENRIVLKKYMPTAAVKSATASNANVRQQIIAKTPRTKRTKASGKKKTPDSTESRTTSVIKCEPVDGEHLDNEPLLARLASSEPTWRPSSQSVIEDKSKKKSKTRNNPVKRINIKREHRLDLIRAYMQEHSICTLTDLRTAIMSSEREEGLTIHMDRKTLDKLVDELEKQHQFLFRFTARIKQSRTIICLARRTDEIQPNCDLIRKFQIELSQETIEVPPSQKTNDEKSMEDESKSTLDHLFHNDLEEEKLISLKKKHLENLPGFGNCYGYVYKFQRCAILHKFLFYLLYGYEGQTDNEIISNNDSVGFEPPLISDDPHIQSILNSIPETRRYINSNQGVNWKTFVPPIDTRGRSIPVGCLHLDDVLMCMPVSIFLAIVYVPYKVPGLMELLSHPSKRHILVRDLPAEMRYPLVVRRQYLYRIMEVLKYLSTLGLISFVDRPSISRLEKLNNLVYFHPKTYLVNTINQTNNSNGPIDNMTNYPKQNYAFTTLSLVHRYWFDLIEIALNTYRVKIFSRKQERSHMIELLKSAMKPISYDQVQEMKTPLGKANGPAGFDYDLYLFLRKSWKLPYNNKRVLKLLNREANQCCIPVCELRVPIDVALKRSYTRHLTQKRQQHIRKRNMYASSSCTDANMNLSSMSMSMNSVRTRRINIPTAANRTNNRLEYYGHLSRYIIPYDALNQIQFVDRRKKILFQSIRERNKLILQRFNEILHETKVERRKSNQKKSTKFHEEHDSDDDEQLNSTALRVRWSPVEERVISLINATLAFYLPRRQTENNEINRETNNSGTRRPAAFLPFSKELFRACLIRVLPRSARSKTPQNVVRKIKNDMTQSTRLTQLEHLSLLCSTDTYLLSFRNEAKRYLKQRFRSNEHFFVLLFERIYSKFQNFVHTGYLHCVPHGTIEWLPSSKEELLNQYRIIGKPPAAFSPSNLNESTKSILSSTISMAIHSSLLSNERSGTTKAFILHYIFSQYPESLLNEIIYRLMHTDAVITLTKSNDIQRKISNEASTFLAGRAYHINQRYIYRWYSYMPTTILHETTQWIDGNVFSKAQINQDLNIPIDIEQQNQVSIAASLVTFFDSNHFDVRLALPRTLDDEPEMMMNRYDRTNSNDDDDDDDDDDQTNSDENEDHDHDQHKRVFEQVLQSARHIDQTRYEKRKLSIDDGSSSKRSKTKSNDNEISIKSSATTRHQCSECSKSFHNRTSLVRHRHRQHDQHRQIKSNKTSLRPASVSTGNPLGRGRHATDTSSLSCCSIEFHLSNEFLHEQNAQYNVQKTFHTIDKLIERSSLYSAVYDQDPIVETNVHNLILDKLLDAHESGFTFYELHKKVQGAMTFIQCAQNLLDLVQKGSVIAAGSARRVFVHRKHARSWLIHSIRFRQQDSNNNFESLLTSALVDTNSLDGQIKSNTTIEQRTHRDQQLISDQFERIVFVPRPWKSTDGSINFYVLLRMMESLLLFIIDHPGLNLNTLHEHYKSVLQPVAIDDCIELFQQMNCLETVRVPLKESTCNGIDLYSNEDDEIEEETLSYDQENEIERLLMKTTYDHRQTAVYCFPTYDCLTKFGTSFPSSLIQQTRSLDRMPFPTV